MMWKNLNVIYHKNYHKNETNISALNDRKTGCSYGPSLESNMDCLIQVLSHLSLVEKVKCRSVCQTWREAVDQLFSGQRSLRIIYLSERLDKLYAKDKHYTNDTNTYVMTKQIKFQLFHQMMANFPSIKSLTIKNLVLSDVMILVVINTCSQLTSLCLSSCTAKRDYYNNNYINNNHNIERTDPHITSYGWKLLIDTYSGLKELTIKSCDLNDDDCELLLRGFPQITHLDVSDNEGLSGSRLHLLGTNCVSLCVGSLSADVWIYPIIQSLSQSSACFRHLELRGGINQHLSPLKSFQGLRSLSLRFFCPQDQTLDTLSPISRLVHLEKLILCQERCYDEPSAIDRYSLAAIADGCSKLTELVIGGEYGWKLRLDDNSIRHLAFKCRRLERLSLTGNSSQITDTSAQHLLSLAGLRSVSFTSFDNITDEGLIELIVNHNCLREIRISDCSGVSEATLNACVYAAQRDPNRRLSVHFSANKPSKSYKCSSFPANLEVIFEENARSRRQSLEPSAMKLMAVVGMSAIILVMIVITMLVVIIMPIGMLLMMFYDNCVEYAVNNSETDLNKDNPLEIFSFFAVQVIRHLNDTNIIAFIAQKIY